MAKSKKINAAIRRWYLDQVSEIPALNRQWLAAGLSSRDRAQRAWQLRHTARLQARARMDAAEVQLLRARDQALYGDPDGPTFEYFVERGKRAGLTEDAVDTIIIEGSARTDAEISRGFGW